MLLKWHDLPEYYCDHGEEERGSASAASISWGVSKDRGKLKWSPGCKERSPDRLYEYEAKHIMF